MFFSTLVKSTLEIKELKELAVNKEGTTKKREVLTTISIKPESKDKIQEGWTSKFIFSSE